MSNLYQTGHIVLLAANPYHLGIVRANQASSRDTVLVEWMNTLPVEMKPDEIILEQVYRSWHPERIDYDIFEPIYEEQSLWEVSV